MFISGRSALWIFIFVYWLVSTIFLFYIPGASGFEYTFQLNTVAPGNLYSQRWTYDFWIVGMFVLVWAIPLSLAFSMDSIDVSSRWRMTTHLIVTCLYLLWVSASLFYGAFMWYNANSSSPDNFTNRFNDPLYCCVYHTIAQAFCFIRTDCIPQTLASELRTNGAMLFQWSYNLILVVLLAFDIGLVFMILKPSFDELAHEIEATAATEALLEAPISRRAPRTYKGRK